MSVKKEDIHLVLPEKKVGRKSKADMEKYLLQRKEFARNMLLYEKLIGMKISSRGWCYIAEGDSLINKGDFDTFQDLINECRKEGDLPIEFVKVDESRQFDNVEDLTNQPMPPEQYVKEKIFPILENQWDWKDDVAFWQTQDFYLQMMVEKIDVKTLFNPICKDFRVPIANARGWSDIHERADFISRFKEAHDLGKKCILLYFGDFDPAGILIAEKLKKNIDDLAKATGFDSTEITIDHFGLSFKFIEQNNLLWINNLETGGKDDSGNARHANEKLGYVREYVEKYGRRKCEANAILKIREIGRQLCKDAIAKYIDFVALGKFNAAIKEERAKVKAVYEKLGIFKQIEDWTSVLDEILNNDENNSGQDLNSLDAPQSDQIEMRGTQDLEPEKNDQAQASLEPDRKIIEFGNPRTTLIPVNLRCPKCHIQKICLLTANNLIEMSLDLLALLNGRKYWQDTELDYKCLHCRLYDDEFDAMLEKHDLMWIDIEDEFRDLLRGQFYPPSAFEQIIRVYLEWRKSLQPQDNEEGFTYKWTEFHQCRCPKCGKHWEYKMEKEQYFASRAEQEDWQRDEEEKSQAFCDENRPYEREEKLCPECEKEGLPSA